MLTSFACYASMSVCWHDQPLHVVIVRATSSLSDQPHLHCLCRPDATHLHHQWLRGLCFPAFGWWFHRGVHTLLLKLIHLYSWQTRRADKKAMMSHSYKHVGVLRHFPLAAAFCTTLACNFCAVDRHIRSQKANLYPGSSCQKENELRTLAGSPLSRACTFSALVAVSPSTATRSAHLAPSWLK
jgi:hypothetical protein